MYTNFPIYKNGKRNLISYNDDYFINDSKDILENVKGVVRITHNEKILNKDGEQGIFPLGLMFHLSKELLADKIKNCYSSNDYVIMELLNNDTIILVDCNNNFKYSKFDNLKSTGIDYSKFNHISIGWMI